MFEVINKYIEQIKRVQVSKKKRDENLQKVKKNTDEKRIKSVVKPLNIMGPWINFEGFLCKITALFLKSGYQLINFLTFGSFPVYVSF